MAVTYDSGAAHGQMLTRMVDSDGYAIGNNSGSTVHTLTAASATVQSADQVNAGASGIHLVIDITAISGTTPTLTVTLQGKDPASGKYYTILASAALNAVATTVLRIFPGATAAANLAANDRLPRTWRVNCAIGGTTPSVTATIGASVLY